MISYELLRQLVENYRHACLLDVEAIKPGNVYRGSDHSDMRSEDFIASARVSADVLAGPGVALGDRILRAVQCTREVVSCNTNLGIVLLAAPLLQSMWNDRPRTSLQSLVGEVVRETQPEQTARIMQAIALAGPGGLGSVERYDVVQAGSAPLREVMAEAAGRDMIARQYVNGFADVFQFAIPGYITRLARWRDERWAVTGLFLDILRRFPDSHIERRFGRERAERVSALAAPASLALESARDPEAVRDKVLALDELLKRDRINPGTSADLTVAAVLAARLVAVRARARRDRKTAPLSQHRFPESRRQDAAIRITPE